MNSSQRRLLTLSVLLLANVYPLIGCLFWQCDAEWVVLFFWFETVIIGALYSLPGGFFTMVPYPLAPDAAPYWREFADGGLRAFVLTIGFGAIIGLLCGFFRKLNTKKTGGTEPSGFA